MTGIRTAVPADIPALTRLINAAYRVEDFFVNGDRTTHEELAQMIATPGTVFLLLQDDDRLLGAARVDVGDGDAHLAMLGVDPERQGQGIARRLIDAVEAHGRRAGCTRLVLEVVDLRTELLPFYLRLGFTRTGTVPFHAPEKLTRPAHLVTFARPI